MNKKQSQWIVTENYRNDKRKMKTNLKLLWKNRERERDSDPKRKFASQYEAES